MENRITVGTKYSHQFSFSQEDVIKFADASGDHNPIHLNSEFASKTIFKKTIIHGLLGGSVFSKIFGTLFPGEGTIYLKQNLSFLKPMFIHQLYTANIIITNVIIEKNRAVVKTTIVDNSNEVIIDGEAIIKHHLIY